MARAAQMAERPSFTIVLRPEPGVADPVIALRRFLKLALRTFGLKAVAVAEQQGNPARQGTGKAARSRRGQRAE